LSWYQSISQISESSFDSFQFCSSIFHSATFFFSILFHQMAVSSSSSLTENSSSPFYLSNGDHPGSLLVSQPLTGDNYNTWSRWHIGIHWWFSASTISCRWGSVSCVDSMQQQDHCLDYELNFRKRLLQVWFTSPPAQALYVYRKNPVKVTK